MNPLIARQLAEISKSIATLQELATRYNRALAKQNQEKDQLLQQRWRYQREASTLKRLREDYEELETQSHEYRQREKLLAERLRRILAYTKTLRSQFPP